MLIFMEFCAEGTLESLVAGSGNGLPESLVRKYTHQLLSAVAALHSHGIVHRDIKSNYKIISNKIISCQNLCYLQLHDISFFPQPQIFF